MERPGRRSHAAVDPDLALLPPPGRRSFPRDLCALFAGKRFRPFLATNLAAASTLNPEILQRLF